MAVSLAGCAGGHTQAYKDICNDPDFQTYVAGAVEYLTIDNVELDKVTYKTNWREWELDSYIWADGLATYANDIFGKKMSGLSENEKDLKAALVKYKSTANSIKAKLVPYLQDTSDTFSTDWYIETITLNSDALGIAVACTDAGK